MSSPEPAPVQLSAREAVQAAVKAIPDLLGGRMPKGLRVEEVRPPQEDNRWRVTLSFLEPADVQPEHPLFAGVFPKPPPEERVLRVVEIEASTGEAQAMVRRESV